MTIHSINQTNRKKVTDFFIEDWGSPQMVISTGIYHCDQLDRWIYKEDDDIYGLLTYVIHKDSIEIISLDN